jgi:gamma-glutamyltranspeptidase
MYLDAQGNVIEDASIVGYKAIGVPGSVAGMVYAERKYGKLSLEKKVMAPAIKLAEKGSPRLPRTRRFTRRQAPGPVSRVGASSSGVEISTRRPRY